jgi:23S rRNA pseudouridine1911/1915/1917 synthase
MNTQSIQVIYEDNHIIAVNKRTSDIVQADKTGDVPLSDHVKQYIKKKFDKPGDVYLGVVHRIDRPVSGVVLFARTSKMAARLSELFQTKEIQKTYWAVVKDKPKNESGRLVHFLKKNEAKNMSKAFDKEQEGALRSELEYKILCSSDNYHLLEVRPITGRHHQIRVQLAAMGCPIKGDLKYGAKRSNENGGISLHARKVEFIHPVKNEPLVIIADPPNDSLWSFFVKMGAK